MNINATHQDILGALSKSSSPLTAEEIAKSLGTLRNKVNIPLNQMLKEGLIATNSTEPGPPKFQMAEGAAKFELSAAPAPKAAAKTAVKAASKTASKAAAKPASKTAAKAAPKAAAASKGQKVVDINQGTRKKQAAVSTTAPQVGASAPAGSASALEPRLQVLQLLSAKTRREEEFLAIAGHEAILGDLIANELVTQDEILGEMTFKLTPKGRTEFPKSYFESLPKPEPVKAAAAAPAAPSADVTALPARRKPGRPSNKELAERRAAEASTGTAANTQAGDGQQAAQPAPALELTAPVAPKRRGRPSNAELARRAAEAEQSGAQPTPTAQPAKAPAKTKQAQKPAQPAQPAPSAQSAEAMALSGDDMLEFNRLISRMFDEKTQNLRLQNESYRKEAVELAKSMSALAANIAAVSERILKIFG